MSGRACLLFAASLAVACTRVATIGYVERSDRDAASELAETGPADAETFDADAATWVDDCVPDLSTTVPLATVQALRGAGEAGAEWLYPYDQTVFPRGLGAPTWMWKGADAEAVRVHVSARQFDYEVCLLPGSPRAVTFSDAAWSRIERASQGRDDPLTIALTMTSKGRVIALPPRTIIVASEALSGSLYYMAYRSPLAPTTPSGAVFRVRLGDATAQPVVAPISCAGCHGVAAGGSRLLAYANGLGAGLALSGQTLSPLPGAPPNAEQAALSPDGSLYVAPARATGLGPRFLGPSSTLEAALFETDSGQLQPSAGIAVGAMMPAFAPEGNALVFTDAALAQGKGLAVMRFDTVTRRASGYRIVFQDELYFPGWPTFLPVQRGVVFALGERNDYSGNGARLFVGTGSGPHSDVYALGLNAETATPAAMLHRAMGFGSAEDAAAERSYLPFGAEELHQNYNPQAAPMAAGGYYWVFFDSIRHYGNLGLRRQIWCAAVDQAPDGSFDPSASHPAFFVRGQDLNASTFRPIFARDAR